MENENGDCITKGSNMEIFLALTRPWDGPHNPLAETLR